MRSALRKSEENHEEKGKTLRDEGLFEENTFDSWANLERHPHFADRRFKKEKLPLGMGFRRASISQQTLENPFELFDLIYGSTRSGMFSIQYDSYCMFKIL